jgi:hypothetical protein
MILEDGAGSGVYAKVTKNQQLFTRAVNETYIMYESRVNGNAFTAGISYDLSVGTDARSVMVVHNAETEKNFIINSVSLSHDGGSSTYNKHIKFQMYIDSALPTTNIQGSAPVAFYNLNSGNNRVTLVKAYLWDGVSTGLDGAKGTSALVHYTNKGLTVLNSRGTSVLGPGAIFRIDLTGVESTKVSISMEGMLWNPSAD